MRECDSNNSALKSSASTGLQMKSVIKYATVIQREDTVVLTVWNCIVPNYTVVKLVKNYKHV